MDRRNQVVKSAPFCKQCPRFEQARCVPDSEDPDRSEVVIVGDQPDSFSACNNRPMNGHAGRIVRTAIDEIKRLKKEFAALSVKYTYAVQCMPIDEENPPMAVMEQCKPLFKGGLTTPPPKIVVALGAAALKQLGYKGKFNDVRGKVINLATVDVPVMVTFAQKALLANTGLYEAFKLDLQNAFTRVLKDDNNVVVSLEELSKNYVLPKTIDEAIAVCDEILHYTQHGEPNTWAISVDTETTTLHAHKEDAKIIAFCFAWDKGKATTVLYDHPAAGEEYLSRLPELHKAVQRLLASPKPKILHNAKFDLKFLENKYGFVVNNVVWDSLLGEHLLEEEKKGAYGLKALTAGWLPEYCGYEDKLHDLLEAQEATSQLETIDDEISNLQEIISDEHQFYVEEMKQYREAVSVYEKQYAQYELDLAAYEGAIAGYEFAKKELADLQDKWQILIANWQKSFGRKPKKPTKWFKKPKKPAAIKKPKKPKDPRTNTEKRVFSDAGFEKIPIHDLQIYGAVDADVTRQLTKIQISRMKKEKSQVRNLMANHGIPASRTLGRMEFGGTKVNQEYIDVLDTALGKIVEETEKEIYDMVGKFTPKGDPLNINHPMTLGNVVYNWGWTHPNGTRMAPFTVQEYTSKKQPSVAEQALRAFVEYKDDENTIPTDESYIIERVLTYRKAYKAKNTFLANIKALSRRDGYLHTQFHLTGTSTGRLSSSDMNMQNVPAWLAGWNIKKLFVPSSDDMVIVDADYSGAEVRVFTAYARDKKLIDALNEGLDMHSFFASKVFNRPYEDYQNRENASIVADETYRKTLKKERTQIKRVVFGILYGAGPGKIAETIGTNKDHAQELINLLFSMFPSIAGYIKQTDLAVMKHGYVETLFGRRRRFPLARLSRHRTRAQRQARNFKIQSTSSDIVINRLLELDRVLRKDFQGRMLLTVHDSVVFEYPKKYIHQLKDFLLYYGEQKVKENFPWLPVPFKIDIEVGPSYGEVHNIDKYIANLPPYLRQEGIVEENEFITELKEDAFEGAA
jgi:uracil-DNA glycosylase family 4